MAEFAYNNSVTIGNGVSPFFANYGFHPATLDPPDEEGPLNPASTVYGHWMQTVHEESPKGLEAAQEQMQRYTDPAQKEPPAYQVGDLIMLNSHCHGACQLLGLNPWRRLECGRKECGVTLSGRMKCGVTLSGRRISLKGAVAHFFLSFFLFLPHATTCLFPCSPIKNLSPPQQPSCPCPAQVLGCCRAPTLSCPVIGCPLRADPVLSCHRPPAARRPCPVLSSAAHCTPTLSCPLIGRPLRAVLVLVLLPAA